MIDRKFIGHEFAASEIDITRWRISQFANAIRNSKPIYYDVHEAKKQGFKDIPVPPTFFSRMTFSDPNFFATLGVDFRKLLDGGREIKYYSQCQAGDTISYQTKVENIVEKEGKRGKMDLITVVTSGKNKDTGVKVFDLIVSLIVFH